ncbi:MAG: hypothetical protein O3A47_02890 [Chloroflexi bacterium]|nr:hypothetical protein [Chloroflexota bacterium]
MADRNRLISLGTLAATTVVALLVVGCGSGGASQSEVRTLLAEACTEGEAREIGLYIKNLDDFEWQEAKLTVTKGGETYLLGSQGGHIDDSRWVLLDVPPQSVREAEPFTDPSEFTTRGTGPVPNNPNYARPLLRLGSFSHLQSATISIRTPFEAEWTGDVHPCQ